MRGQAGFWDVGERYPLLCDEGDPLVKLIGIVPREVLRRPPCDFAMIFPDICFTIACQAIVSRC